MKTINSLGALLLTVMLIPDVSFAQLCATRDCTGTTGGGKNCTVMTSNFRCLGPEITVGHGVSTAVSVNAICSANSMTGFAMHNPLSDSTATCGFQFSKLCSWISASTILTRATDCQIDMSDGLPVELMEFSVE